eukprot:COSAG02_NODE_254_length_26937_cov_16.503950_28_plen_721_part_00
MEGPVVFIPHEFRCPISGDLMEDPVVAEDRRSYERDIIEAWFAQCIARGQPRTSPVTREAVGARLVENYSLKQAIAELREQQHKLRGPLGTPKKGRVRSPASSPVRGPGGEPPEGMPGAVGTVHELGEIFGQIDPLRELLAQCLDGWQPPSLVIVGNEKSGKSSQLERLCMMPMFPHDEAICTRLPIEVRLRRGPSKAPRLETFNTQTQQTEGELIDVPMETANIDVRREMDRLVKLHNQAVTGVCSERSIILHVHSPDVPNLDLVDLPGLVTAAAAGEPDDMPQRTRALVAAQIDERKAHSMFLCSVSAVTAPNTSTALQLLKEKQVLDKTIGVITMCDFATAPQLKKKVHQRLQQTGDAVELQPHGYVATMNAPVDGELSNLEKLQQQAIAEPGFFAAQRYQEQMDAGLVTTVALLERINTMFINYVKDSWVPDTLSKLGAELKRLQDANKALGLPAAHGRSCPAGWEVGEGLDTLHTAAQVSVAAVMKKEIPWMMDQFAQQMQKLSRDLEAVLPTSHTLPTAGASVDGLHAYLAKTRAKVTEICTAASDDEQLAEWVQTALIREDSPFKLSRFPQIVEACVTKVKQLLQPCKAEFRREVGECIAQQLSFNGVAVIISHDWSARPMSSTVTLDQKRCIGAITDLYARRRLHILETELPESVMALVKATIKINTEDACNGERVDLLHRMDCVIKAMGGIKMISNGMRAASAEVREVPCP